MMFRHDEDKTYPIRSYQLLVPSSCRNNFDNSGSDKYQTIGRKKVEIRIIKVIQWRILQNIAIFCKGMRHGRV